MPVLDGYATTHRLRELGMTAKNGAPLPVLAMTANALEDDRQECIGAGMDAYISKPYSYDNLVSTLESLLPDSERLSNTASAMG